ncbi:MAG TPA: MerR family transcriptional regulator [Methylocystis sp.]|nr:MerR family transcriptional regulator [Methylocystis sp.]
MAVEKREGAFLTIGEVAEKLDLPAHVLRFWETRFTELEPMKRAGGRRYYRPRDVALATALRALLYGQGYTIKGVQRLLRERGVNAVIESARTGAPPPPAAAGEEDAEPSTPPPGERRVEPAFEEPAADPPKLPAVIAPALNFVGGLGDEEIRALRLALADLAEARRLLLLSKG